jgi:hypothetical protein
VQLERKAEHGETIEGERGLARVNRYCNGSYRNPVRDAYGSGNRRIDEGRACRNQPRYPRRRQAGGSGNRKGHCLEQRKLNAGGDAGTGATGATGGAAVTMPSNFVTGSGFVPSAARGGRGRSIYDFGSLAVGGFIFVPATTDRPNPAKSLASTVSSATKRSAPKVYRVQSVKGGQAYGEFTPPSDGAVIYRAADATPAA